MIFTSLGAFASRWRPNYLFNPLVCHPERLFGLQMHLETAAAAEAAAVAADHLHVENAEEVAPLNDLVSVPGERRWELTCCRFILCCHVHMKCS